MLVRFLAAIGVLLLLAATSSCASVAVYDWVTSEPESFAGAKPYERPRDLALLAAALAWPFTFVFDVVAFPVQVFCCEPYQD